MDFNSASLINTKRLFVLFIFLSFSCRKDPTVGYVKYQPAKCNDTVYYDAEIRVEIIDKSCNVAGCHDATAAGGLSYTNHAEVSAMTHPMYLTIIHDTAAPPMPYPTERLPDSLLNKFYCWIQQGRLNN
ncbi:MAG: hypothetical protein GQ574_18930 [Crocinitomix sp.]|nr:hypothetical protein [Crocinitomix sp.]